MDSLFWKAVHGAQRGYVEGYERGYGRFAVIDDRRGRLFVFMPGLPLEHLSIRAKGDWCEDYVAQLQREMP